MDDNSKKNKEKDELNQYFDVQFIKNHSAKLALHQYFEEFKSTYFSESIRSPIIIAGAIVEALLIESLLLIEIDAKNKYKQKNNNQEKDIRKMRFEELVDISLSCGIIPSELEKQTDTLRDFRNYVHIHRAANSSIQLDNHYKDLCKNALFIILKEIKSWYSKCATKL